MVDASPFLQQLVRHYAYTDFVRIVAQYYHEANQLDQVWFLLIDGYTIFCDWWPMSPYAAVQVCPSLKSPAHEVDETIFSFLS